MKKNSIRKLTIAGVLVAVAVVGSLFSIPVLGAKCSPVQHMVNVLGAVLLGPWYALGMGFAAALIRNVLGLGSLLAFPGSMIDLTPLRAAYPDASVENEDGIWYCTLSVREGGNTP